MSEHKKIEHAAALVAALPSQTATQLLSRLTPADVHQLIAVLADDSRDSSVLLKDVVRQFQADAGMGKSPNSSEQAFFQKPMFANNQPKAAEGIYGLSFLADLDVETRCRVLHGEAPSEIAKALAMLSPEVAAETLDRFDDTLQARVIECITQAEDVYPEDIVQLRLVLMKNLNRIQILERHSSLTLAISRRRLPTDLLRDADETIDIAAEASTSLPTSVRRPLLGMDRLSGLTENDIKAVLKFTDTSLWAPALKNATPEVKEQVFDCMAAEAAALLRIEIEQLESVSPFDEESARNKIVASALKLASQGQVLIERQTGKAAG